MNVRPVRKKTPSVRPIRDKVSNGVHERFMSEAIKLALKGKGKTSPNPMVGAVIVKDGRTISKGYHHQAGKPHAEIMAMRKARTSLKGATLYVNLEPCSFKGRTPACTQAIIKSGIKEVVVGSLDPNPRNNGKGIRILKSHGLKTKTGVLQEKSRKINEAFNKFITSSMPFVTVKIAQSLDGKIATSTGNSRWITAEAARRYVHKLRAEVDAVLVGANTIIKDDPLLTPRLSSHKSKKIPYRVVVDSRLKVPLGAKIFSRGSLNVILATTKSCKGFIITISSHDNCVAII